MLHSAMDHNGLTPHLSHILSAEAVQVFKPRPEVYTLATQQFALTPQEIAFVSSNTWDVAGARSFGLYAIWLRRGGIMDHLGHPPGQIIQEISALR